METRAIGKSLHVGLNKLNGKHYRPPPWDLAGCENDAKAMEEIANSRGFKTELLLTAGATRKAIMDRIEKAARTLPSGSIFFFTFSGHGGQVKDTGGDERYEDMKDETICAYDGQILDDELRAIWPKFKSNVRILMIADSCHSGTITRLMPEEGRGRPRGLTDQIAEQTLKLNQDFYHRIWDNLKEIGRAPQKAAVRSLAACQDDEEAADGTQNGAFTEALLAVWNGGRFSGNYKSFLGEISKRIPQGYNQQPMEDSWGPPIDSYDEEKPFTI